MLETEEEAAQLALAHQAAIAHLVTEAQEAHAHCTESMETPHRDLADAAGRSESSFRADAPELLVTLRDH